MPSPYHAGERAVQERAGVQHMASRIARSIGTSMPPAARQFLQQQPMVVVASTDERDQTWASLLTGAPGFIEVVDERTVRLHARPVPGDPLGNNLRSGSDVGLLAIELATRRRMRLNGTASLLDDGGAEVRARQVYSNCPKYIQARERLPAEPAERTAQVARRTETLSEEQQRLIARADTFFIATAHSEGGADASHRGGLPGFVAVVDERTLLFPDYAGNTMFNTLGNITANPHAGMLFLDFERGDTLQLTGRAAVVWDMNRLVPFAGAERGVQFRVGGVVATAGAAPFRWRFLDPSPFNPRPV